MYVCMYVCMYAMDWIGLDWIGFGWIGCSIKDCKETIIYVYLPLFDVFPFSCLCLFCLIHSCIRSFTSSGFWLTRQTLTDRQTHTQRPTLPCSCLPHTFLYHQLKTCLSPLNLSVDVELNVFVICPWLLSELDRGLSLVKKNYVLGRGKGYELS